MPRGEESKALTHEKHRQLQDEAMELEDAQDKTAEEGGSPSCSAHDSGDAVSRTSTDSCPQKIPRETATFTPGKGARGQKGDDCSRSEDSHSTENPQIVILSRKTGMLMQNLLSKSNLK